MATVSEKVHGAPAIAEADEELPTQSPLASAPEPVTPEYSDFPCSVAQERFWLLDRLEPGNPAYNVAVRWQLEGTVATALLERAWNEILARHEILRTRFLEIDGRPVQRVQAHAALKISEIDQIGRAHV